MECEIPRIQSNKDEIKTIFDETKTIAIIGLSPKEDKASNIVARYLQNAGFKIIPVYPKEDIILGEKVYRSLDEIQEQIDIVDIFRKPDIVSLVVDQAIAMKNIKTIWTQVGIVNNDAAKKAREAGMKVVQNLCTKLEHKDIY
jgi:predicted CoA-binding protein